MLLCKKALYFWAVFLSRQLPCLNILKRSKRNLNALIPIYTAERFRKNLLRSFGEKAEKENDRGFVMGNLLQDFTTKEVVMSKQNSVPNRTYKSTIFIRLMEDKRKLLEVYNAVSGNHYTDPELLTINTLENAIYMSIKNDVSFLIDSRLYLYEHQSTYSPNLPLRMLLYLGDLYAGMTENENLYGRKLVKIPPPQFLIFYNGQEELPDQRTLRLSDMYAAEETEHKLELEAVMLNINAGHNPELLETCSVLWEYAEYTARVRKYARELPVEDAVENAIVECIEEGILEDFLRKNRAEAKNMSIYEYNQEKHLRQEREASWEEGREAGIREGREVGIREGRESGISESRRQTAINLSKMGMDVEKIAQAVEANVEEVQTWLADGEVRK